MWSLGIKSIWRDQASRPETCEKLSSKSFGSFGVHSFSRIKMPELAAVPTKDQQAPASDLSVASLLKLLKIYNEQRYAPRYAFK